MTNVVYRLLITDCASSGPTSIAEWRAYLSPITALAMDERLASASSVSGSNSAGAAFDGDPSTYWESANHPSDSAPEWISCALDPAFSYPWVTWFSITAGPDFTEAPTVFSLQVQSASDPGVWRTVSGPLRTTWSYAGQTQNFIGAITPCTPMPLPAPPDSGGVTGCSGATVTTLAGGGSHAYWRLAFTLTNGGGPDTEVTELDFFTASSGDSDVATGGTPLGTLTPFRANYPSAAFDDDLGTSWGRGTELGYQFPAPVSITRFAITNGISGSNWTFDSPTAFTLDWSDDGSTWTQAWAFTVPSSCWTGPAQVMVFRTPS